MHNASMLEKVMLALGWFIIVTCFAVADLQSVRCHQWLNCKQLHKTQRNHNNRVSELKFNPQQNNLQHFGGEYNLRVLHIH